MPSPRIVHRESSVAQKSLFPLGKEVRVSAQASELLQDLRDAVNLFGQETDSAKIPALYEGMQLRMRDAAQYISVMEKHFGTEQAVVMKF